MNNNIKITRCPKCGNAYLDAWYDTSFENHYAGVKGFMRLNLLSVLLNLFRDRKRVQKMWVCNSCGHRFPME